MLYRRSGFTLVELLVVIAIIALLLAMLFPSMQGAINAAKVTGCLNNMRSISTAYTLFAADNEGKTPGPNWGSNSGPWPEQIGWLYSGGKMDLLEDIRSGQLYPYMKNERAMRCPADFQPDESDPQSAPNRPNNSRMITSYCSNGSMCRYGRRYYDRTTKLWDTYRIGQFRALDIMFWEPDEFTGGSGSVGNWWDASNSPGQQITRRHMGRVVVGNNDGHAEWIDTDDFEAMSPWPIQKKTRTWNVPDTYNGGS